jgi:hypothetical protein
MKGPIQKTTRNQPKQNKMKNLRKTILVAVATGLVSCVVFSQQAQAVPVAGFTGTATLASTSVPGNFIFVDYSVDLTGGTYTYSYVLRNPATDTTNVHGFSVSFQNSGGVAFNVTGGNANSPTPDGVSWFFFPTGIVPGGNSGTLSFQSLIGPTFGNGNATDTNPPSPWGSTPGGTQLPVPRVPDGGTTVSMLGLAFAGIEGMRRILRARRA